VALRTSRAALVTTSLRASTEKDRSDPPRSASSDPAVSVATSSAGGTTPAPPDPATLLRPVVVVTVPTDATVFQGTRNLGISPVTVAVPPDGTITIRIEHPGYVTKEKVIDGSRPRESISLDHDFRPGSRPSSGRPLPTPATASAKAAAPLSPSPTAGTAKSAVKPAAPEPCDLPKMRDPFNGVCH